MNAIRLPTRVLMTTDAIGGVWTYSLDLARWLNLLGVETILVSMGRPCTPAQRREAWSVPTLSLIELPFKLEWMDEPWEDVDEAGEQLLELEQRHAPDLVHLNGYAHGAVDFAAPKLVVAHSCVFSWWQAVHREPTPARYEVYRRRVAAGLSGADAVVSVSQSMQRELALRYGFQGKTRIIYNGCDAALFVPDIKEKLVFSAGRFWDAAKNLCVLNASAPTVAWPVVAAGDDTRPPGATGHVFDQASHVRMLGRLSRSETANWLGKAAIFALPARYEPFGLAVLEAALSGCALVLGDIPSLRELWDGAALFVHPDDPQGLASAINTLIADPVKRLALSRQAMQRAEPRNLRRMTETYVALYQRMLEQRVGRPQSHQAALF